MSKPDHTRTRQARPLLAAIYCLVVSICGDLAESAEPPVCDAEQAIRARIAADNKAIAAVRRAVADKLEKSSVKQFVNPEAELPFASKTVPPKGKWVLWYQQPGSYWTDALPLGNGRLGAMIFGAIRHGIVQLNEDTLWSGKPIDRAKPGAAKYLDEARRLLFEGRYEEGQKLVYEKIMGLHLNHGIHTYQALGNVELEFQYDDAPITEYQRQLDLDTGIAAVSYIVGETCYRREVFISAPDQVEERIAPPFHGIGFSRAWLVNFFARLHDGDAAYDQLTILLGRARKNLFNTAFTIEPNFAAPAGVAEMLLQSHQGYIELLPALPAAWREGHVKGLRARGGFEVDIAWRHGKPDSASVKSLLDNPCRIRYGDKLCDLEINKGDSVRLDYDLRLVGR